MRVESAFEVERARRAARALAVDIGFAPADTESVVLAVSELAANLVRHAQGGRIELSRIEGSVGMQIESHDLGPVDIVTEDKETVPISPILGGAAIVGGIALLLTSRKNRA